MRIIYNLFLFIVLTLLMCHCAQKKYTVYVRNIPDTLAVSTSAGHLAQKDYHIQPDDVLYVKILSINQDIKKIFNFTEGTSYTSSWYNETSMYINGFMVNDSGTISLPVMKDVMVAGLTIDEVQDTVQEIVNEYLNDATVVVRLVSFRITVIGEVRNPGVYTYYKNSVNILEAVGRAGDISDYGNKSNVVVIRPGKEENITFRLNLTNKDLLTQENFYLEPNDIVYVEPLNLKRFRLNAPNISILFSSISTLILVLNFIK